jgi:predicted glycosyltransferase
MPLRIWIDMTAPAHPVVFRPIIRLLREAGHEVEVTARDYAQTIPLLQRMGIAHTAVGRHGGASRARKLQALVSRTFKMRRFAANGRFDLAVAHGSNDLALAAASLRIPAVNTFDYEFAVQQHNIGCRLARRVMTPDAIPAERLERYGVGPDKLVQYAGLKEEYYLADFEPDPAVLAELGLDRQRPIAVVRTPPAVSLYHRFENPLFAQVLDRLRGEQAVVLPRTPEQRAELAGFIVPEQAIDAQSLVAYADLVISAGGTMNREAVALGTPVWTTFEGRLGAVDEALIADGRMHRLVRAEDIALEKRPATTGERTRRDPAALADLLLSPIGGLAPGDRAQP